MKASYKGFEAKKAGGFTDLPVAGAYVAEIQAVRFVAGEDGQRDRIECFMEITEGEYKDRFHQVYEDQKERFGDDAKYKGIFRLVCPFEDDDDWRKRTFEGNLWCVMQSNAGYSWDWDEKKLKGKKVGINLRNRLYTYNGKDRSTVEIARFETVDDVRNGKCKPAKDRDQREKNGDSAETNGSEFTDVSKDVAVPW
jgi:hypothetical protein